MTSTDDLIIHAKVDFRGLRAQIAAAYACDRDGREHEAVVYYERAHALGGPKRGRAQFLLGYGSTLRNVGRVEESLAILSDAVRAYPRDRALRIFLALALHSSRRHGEAMASLLRIILGLDRHAPDIQKFRRAIASYAELLETEDFSVTRRRRPSRGGRSAAAKRPRRRARSEPHR